MKVEVWMQKSSQPIVFEDAKATYQKGDMFCIAHGNTRTKYPINSLYQVKEYPEKMSGSEKEEDAEWKCPVCGCTETWFDRSVSYCSDGEESALEGPTTRCAGCGLDVDDPYPR